MSFYAERVLPRLIDLAMRQRQLVPLRERLVAEAAGDVVEIGIGSGRNLPFYRRDLLRVTGIDPSPQLLERARKNATWTHFPVRLIKAPAEDLPLDDASADTVVMSWTLCSVDAPARALAEIRRVLRPGGTLLFIEHGRAPEAGVRRWQERLSPLWCRLAGGCHLDRPIDHLLEGAGLIAGRLETGYLVAGPRPFTFHYRGCATPV